MVSGILPGWFTRSWDHSMMRLALSLVLFILSTLNIVPAMHYVMWVLSIFTSEAGYWMAPVALLIGFYGNRLTLKGIVIMVLSFSSFILLLLPVAQAYCAYPQSPTDFANGLLGYKKPAGIIKEAHLYDEQNKLMVSVYQSALIKKEKRPVVMVIHGGGWNSGNRDDLEELNYLLAAQGYVVFSPDYRLAPEHHFPSPIQDIEKCFRYMVSNRYLFRADTASFFLMGRSAGGQVALCAAFGSMMHKTRGVIAFYTPSDMVWADTSHFAINILDSDKLLNSYAGTSFQESPEAFIKTSPVHLVKIGCPPVLMIHGLKDNVVSPLHNEHLIARLKRFGVPFEYLKLPWATHGFDFIPGGPGAEVSENAVISFLSKHL